MGEVIKDVSGAAATLNRNGNDQDNVLPVVNSNGDAPPGWSQPNHQINYEQFLNWADEDTLAEWVNGNIIMTSPASYRHQELGSYLNEIVRIFVRVNDLGRVIQPPFQMHLPGISGREPDLIFVRKERLGILRNSYTQGPADLAVEIVSPESVSRDHTDKFGEYAAGGVPEYWLLDATTNTAIFYRLNQEGQYQIVPLDEQGRYYSQAITGFWLKPSWLSRQPLPEPMRILRLVGGAALIDFLVAQSQQADDEL